MNVLCFMWKVSLQEVTKYIDQIKQHLCVFERDTQINCNCIPQLQYENI
jgi:hypothetical protein